MIAITSFYASLLGLLFVFLTIRTIRLRRAKRIALGAGDDPELERAIRVHSNFAEYVPLALILIGMLELRGAGAWLLNGLGALLLVGRCVHAYGVSQRKEDFRLRVSGMTATLTTIVLASLINLAYGAMRLF